MAPACQRIDTPPPTRPSTVLRIGAPEYNFGDVDVGLQQIARILSLESLTTLGTDGRALPSLADRWNWAADGLALRLHIRSGIQTHTGRHVNAELIAQALTEAVTRPSNLALYWSLADVSSIEATGGDELVVSLRRRSGALPEDLDIPLAFGPNSDGTGPYKVVKNEATEVVMERFDSYYGGRPTILQVVAKPYPTLRTAWTSLLRGEIDLVTNVSPDALQFVRSDSIRVTSHLRRYQYLVAFNSTRPPFVSPIVRRALNLAVDRTQLVSRSLDGHGVPATGPLWPRHWAYDATIQPFMFDSRSAETLLESAGFPIARGITSSGQRQVRFTFTCLLPANFSTLERMALELQRQLYDIGVDMKFDAIPADEYSKRVREGRFEAVLIDMISGPTFGRPYIFWRSAKGFRGLNVFGYENVEAERLFDVLRESTNEGAIRSAAKRLQRVFLEDPPAMFLVWNERTRAISRQFTVTEETDRDPLYTLWRWTASQPPSATAQ
ncbi:MAG: ABC transporter substrate-binding protein [Vicinamibacterales bacterium]